MRWKFVVRRPEQLRIAELLRSGKTLESEDGTRNSLTEVRKGAEMCGGVEFGPIGFG